jgi:hypothetical protein
MQLTTIAANLALLFCSSPVSFAALSNHSIKRSIQYHCEDGISPELFYFIVH